jgi:hypothetical protein
LEKKRFDLIKLDIQIRAREKEQKRLEEKVERKEKRLKQR